jgi:hypothetical protein
MEFPTRAVLMNNCSTDPKVQKKIKNYQVVCGCMADKMSQYVSSNGASIIAKSLKENAGEVNPLKTLMASPDFQAQAQAQMASCMQPQTTNKLAQ